MPGPLRAGELGVEAGAIDRQADAEDAGEIARQAVGHEAEQAAIARHAHEQVAGHRCGGEAVGCGDENVARLAAASAANSARLSAGPQWQVIAMPTRTVCQRRQRLDAIVERAAAAIASTT